MDNNKEIKIIFNKEEIQKIAVNVLERELTENEFYHLQKRVNYSMDLIEEVIWDCVNGLPEWIDL